MVVFTQLLACLLTYSLVPQSRLRLLFLRKIVTIEMFYLLMQVKNLQKENQNKLAPEHIDKIVSTYIERQDVEKYAHVATFEEIVENDYNLNIPRYVDTFEEELPVDLVALNNEIKSTNQEIKKVEAELLAMLDDLVVTEETQALIDATKEVFGG